MFSVLALLLDDWNSVYLTGAAAFSVAMLVGHVLVPTYRHAR